MRQEIMVFNETEGRILDAGIDWFEVNQKHG
jgi:hypothetical protein